MQNMDTFSFLELNDNTSEKPSYRLMEIPDNQYLNYLDLVSLSPTPESLRRASRRLMQKYCFIPIFSQPAAQDVRLPGHLDPQYHIRYQAHQGTIAYLALCPPANEMPLRFIRNALGYGFYGLPIKPETFARFMDERYGQITAKK